MCRPLAKREKGRRTLNLPVNKKNTSLCKISVFCYTIRLACNNNWWSCTVALKSSFSQIVREHLEALENVQESLLALFTGNRYQNIYHGGKGNFTRVSVTDVKRWLCRREQTPVRNRNFNTVSKCKTQNRRVLILSIFIEKYTGTMTKL